MHIHQRKTIRQPSRREFVIRLASLAAAGTALTACGGSDFEAPRFDYGVASGDPLTDRVILWTHAQFAARPDDVALTREAAILNMAI